jgi:hypothetical protein
MDPPDKYLLNTYTKLLDDNPHGSSAGLRWVGTER